MTRGPGASACRESGERRVWAILAEKGKTTRKYYRQRSGAGRLLQPKSNRGTRSPNRQDDVEDTLQSLARKGATIW